MRNVTRSEVISLDSYRTSTHTHTQLTDRTTRTTKVVVVKLTVKSRPNPVTDFFAHRLARPVRYYPTLLLQATIARGVSLSNVAHASQSPQSNTRPRAVAVRDVSLSQLAPRIHQFAVIAHAQQLQCDIHRGSTI